MKRIAVIAGSVRLGRNTIRLARFLEHTIDARDDAECDLIDLAELGLPLLEERLHKLEDPPEVLVEYGRRIELADAVVLATPEYNKNTSAALKNAVDALGPPWTRKVVGIASHSVGAFGGNVAQQMLRTTMTSIGALVVPASMTVPRIQQAFSEQGEALDPAFEGRAQRFLDELLWYAGALHAASD